MNVGEEIFVEAALVRLEMAKDARDPAMVIAACRSLEKAFAECANGQPKSTFEALEKSREAIARTIAALLPEGQARRVKPTTVPAALKAYTRINCNRVL